jgi:organic radical activating enzyme
MAKKIFPIRTATSCQLKWNWSSLYLNSGATASCYRTSVSDLTPENFNDFHNTPGKIQDREDMLAGRWPEKHCGYCKNIEDQGGTSTRMTHIDIPDLVPPEVDSGNLTATHVTPQIVEVFFSNFCNLGCLYCNPTLSSNIEKENKKFGEFKQEGVDLGNQVEIIDRKAKDFIPLFWKWFPEGFPKVKRFHILGGEPLLQKEFDKLLDMIEKYPNKDCELTVITNLMLPQERLESYINKVKKLVAARKLRRFDISCSLDCWGPEQEYVRYGLDLEQWQRNFERLLKEKWIYLNINQTISALTIKTMPALLKQINKWRKEHKINQWFSGITPSPEYMNNAIFDNSEWSESLEEILSLMPCKTEQEKLAQDHMKSTLTDGGESNPEEINKLIIYLNEKDRRRNTDWRKLFPWLIKYET